MNRFTRSLDRLRHRRRAGRLVVALLGAGALLLALALAAGLADLGLALEAPARRMLATTTLAVTAGFVVVAAVISLRLRRERAAGLADSLLGSPRRPASAALALDPARAATPLGRHLATLAIDRAADDLDRLPRSAAIPWRALRAAGIALFVPAAVLGVLRVAAPEPFGVVAQRLLDPSRDLPPWSPLRFALDPATPATVFGGDLLLAAELNGAAIDHPVELLVRHPRHGGVLRLPTFRESDRRFSRRLESQTEPADIAFACGKARSPWHRVEILLEPKILAGEVRITPPAYTGRPESTVPLDSNEIAALAGSEVVLALDSNRPLGSGRLTFTPAATGTESPAPVRIEAELPAADRASFRWIASHSGTLSAELRDVRGTPSEAPLELAFRTVPDQAPTVDLSSPPPLLLATPASTVPVAARAEDDHALKRVRLVRTLQGFRDRARTVAPALAGPAFDLHGSLDLGPLGIVPGQTIELFVEAADHNPSLLGQGASDIARIHVISEDDYAYRLRAKTTLAEFSARYRAIAEALRDARQALEAMDRAADVNDAAAREAARTAAAEAHRNAAGLLEQLATDFPAFALEERLQQLARGSADATKANLAELEGFDAAASEGAQREAIRAMLDRLGANQQAREQLAADAALIAQAGTVLEMAARFQRIYQTQESLAKRTGTIAGEVARGTDDNTRLLPSLGDTQQKNRESLDAFASELRRRAEALPAGHPDLGPLRASALEFLDRLALSAPETVMDAAAGHARAGNSNDTFANAELARAMLEQLMQDNSPFPNACQGRCMQFNIPRPDVNRTMQQLLEGLMCQNAGAGEGFGGGGMGLGGTGDSGSAMPGYAALDLPVLGPERMFFDPPATAAGAEGKGRTGPARALPAHAESSRPAIEPTRSGESSTLRLESVPERYREAVKQYFSGDQ